MTDLERCYQEQLEAAKLLGDGLRDQGVKTYLDDWIAEEILLLNDREDCGPSR